MKEKYMKEAIKEAKKALEIGEMPVGAVIVYKDKIISRGYNKKEKLKNSIMHAEIIAIEKACKKMKDWRLNDCDMYVTMEPCTMCIGAIAESRIKNIYYGVENNKTHISNKNIISENNIQSHQVIIKNKIEKQLNMFFKNIRNR